MQRESVLPENPEAFVEDAERRMLDVTRELVQADWAFTTNITPETKARSTEMHTRMAALSTELARQAALYEGVDACAETRRKINLLLRTIGRPAPPDPERNAELHAISARMREHHGNAVYRPHIGAPMNIDAVSEALRRSRNPMHLRHLWEGWYDAAQPAREDYARFVELANEGARSLGYADAGAESRAGRDMAPEAFTAEIDRLWGQLRPFYDALHAYVRRRLITRYGEAEVGTDGTIPLHFLGNLWGQDWSGIEDLVLPPDAPRARASDLGARLREGNIDAREMVRIAERFYTSLGFEPLPGAFWERSMFVAPSDRAAVTHGTAFDMYDGEDFRIRMGIIGSEDDFYVLHHELGHNFYQRAYAGQPFLFRFGANADFHEAVADTIALSVTPKYLARIGLGEDDGPGAGDIPVLLRRALSSIAFLPFGYMVDRWRWDVFAGRIPPAEYTSAWWDRAARYQKVRPPVDRSRAPFDPGAKYHIPYDSPYMPYFVARVLQYQFHRTLCAEAGETGPLHRASIHGSVAAGDKLRAMLALGRSRPWQDALEVLTGSREMDATAIIDYFAPLKIWLDEQNAKG